MKRPHYLARDIVWGIPLVALIVNVSVVALAMVQIRAARGHMKVVVSSAGVNASMARRAEASDASTADTGPVLLVMKDGTIELNGKRMEMPLDLSFQLEKYAAKGSAVRVRSESGADATALADALSLCARAGLTDVIVEASPRSVTPVSAGRSGGVGNGS